MDQRIFMTQLMDLKVQMIKKPKIIDDTKQSNFLLHLQNSKL
jgi:hypothetical protein